MINAFKYSCRSHYIKFMSFSYFKSGGMCFNVCETVAYACHIKMKVPKNLFKLS